MKILIRVRPLCLILILLLGVRKSFTQSVTTPIDELVKRIVPGYAGKLEFQEIDPVNSFDVFELESVKGKVIVRGNNPIAMATGLNHYLKYYCHTFVTWDLGNRVEYPAQAPVVAKKIRKVARVKNRFFLNYCTFGYTMPWWKWDDWQRLIDWMALNGINMPLSITGQEAVWYKVWRKYGLSDDQIRNYFTGPAFLPWHRMANIDRWGGPLPESWIENQFLLEKKIVNRERELGMTPVLPAFAGHVPIDLKTKYPSAKINSLGPWGGFGKQYLSNFLDPFDPLFNQIQRDFLNEQTRAFGTSHIYGIDPFNEVTPPSWEPAYLANAAKAIHASVTQVDPKSIWLQMTWLFYIDREKWTDERIKAYVTAVPKDKMILLDYYCDNTEVWKMTDAYYGQPYLWCYLGNFGGNTMLAGNLEEVEKRMENAMQQSGGNLQGIGSTLEGFDVNPVMYDYVFEKAWSDGPTSVTNWINHWAEMRGGMHQKSIQTAWKFLAEKVYNASAKLGQATLTNARPFISGDPHWTTNPAITYNNKDLLTVWELLLAGGANKNPLWQYDITNVGRQVLGNYFNDLHHEFQLAYEQENVNRLSVVGTKMLNLLSDLDTLLSTCQEFSLEKWLNDARSMGKTETERNYYEENARTLITIWGGEQGSLNDYANRSWAGLTRDYYRERWRLFIKEVITAVKQGKALDKNLLDKRIDIFERAWVKRHQHYTASIIPNAYVINQNLFEKYKKDIYPVITQTQAFPDIRHVLTNKGDYLAGDTVKVSINIYNAADREVKLNDLKVTLTNLVTGKPVLRKILLSTSVNLKTHGVYQVKNAILMKISADLPKGPYGVYISMGSGAGMPKDNYTTFFRVKDSRTLTCYTIKQEMYKGARVFRLNGGMSAEYAVEKAAEGLSVGISHSWEVNGRGSGPNQVYSTPQFLVNAVEKTVEFYDETFGKEKIFNTAIISTGIPSVPYLSYALQAPVLPLHFLVSANTTKEMQSILDYSNSRGYSCYSTLGYDPSVPEAAVAWVKLLDLPAPYLDFLKRHQVKNVVLLGATGLTGGETMARLINLPASDTPTYSPGSLYLLYPQGGVAGDEQAFLEKLKDYSTLDLKKPLIRIADWESGIVEEQVRNFTSSAIHKASVKNIRFITAGDDGELYKLATYVMAAFFHKNNLMPKGIILNPYLIANAFYESRYGYLPFVYWQGNPAGSIGGDMQATVNAALGACFPASKIADLDIWLNSSLNFGGSERGKLLQENLGMAGLKKMQINDASVDEIWNLSDGINAPCELKFKNIFEQFTISSLNQWKAHLLSLTLIDLDEIGKKFPSIVVRNDY